MSNSLFLTGASGYIGSRLLAAIDRGKYRRIVCLGRTKPAVRGFDHIAGDLLNPAAYAAALKGCDTVLHLAALTGKNKPEEYFRVNRDGTRLLLKEARQAGVERFIYVSSIAAKFRNQSRYYYAQSKKQAEALVAAGGLSYSIVRPTIAIGRDAPVLKALYRLAGAPVIPIFGDGRAPVQPVFVHDLATCLVSVLEDRGFDNRIIEVGGPQAISMEELLVKIRQIRFGRPARVVHLPAGITAAALGLLERFLLPVLPVTAGQLASFTNDGSVQPDASVAKWQSRMKNVEEVLRSVSAQ